jgi:serine/threonine protein kinase
MLVYTVTLHPLQGFNATNRLGSGGYGPVYRGMLDGVPVAVKLLDTSGCSSQGPKEFAAEVAILSRLHHPHIVLLIGSCPERCGLVYELLDNGSLEQHLFSSSMPDLAWQVRVEGAGSRAW